MPLARRMMRCGAALALTLVGAVPAPDGKPKLQTTFAHQLEELSHKERLDAVAALEALERMGEAVDEAMTNAHGAVVESAASADGYSGKHHQQVAIATQGIGTTGM